MVRVSGAGMRSPPEHPLAAGAPIPTHRRPGSAAAKKKTSASAWRVTMAPRQLRLEPIAHRGGSDRGQRCQASPRRQHRGVLNTGTKSPPARQPG
eukprot:scaffold7862_cov126-Isochrysis_galbana.AAC.5